MIHCPLRITDGPWRHHEAQRQLNKLCSSGCQAAASLPRSPHLPCWTLLCTPPSVLTASSSLNRLHESTSGEDKKKRGRGPPGPPPPNYNNHKQRSVQGIVLFPYTLKRMLNPSAASRLEGDTPDMWDHSSEVSDRKWFYFSKPHVVTLWKVGGKTWYYGLYLKSHRLVHVTRRTFGWFILSTTSFHHSTS